MRNCLFTAIKKTILKLDGNHDKHVTVSNGYKIIACKFEHQQKPKLRVEVYKIGGN